MPWGLFLRQWGAELVSYRDVFCPLVGWVHALLGVAGSSWVNSSCLTPLPACDTSHSEALCADRLANTLLAFCCKLVILAPVCANFQLQMPACPGSFGGKPVDSAGWMILTRSCVGAAPRLAWCCLLTDTCF